MSRRVDKKYKRVKKYKLKTKKAFQRRFQVVIILKSSYREAN